MKSQARQTPTTTPESSFPGITGTPCVGRKTLRRVTRPIRKCRLELRHDRNVSPNNVLRSSKWLKNSFVKKLGNFSHYFCFGIRLLQDARGCASHRFGLAFTSGETTPAHRRQHRTSTEATATTRWLRPCVCFRRERKLIPVATPPRAAAAATIPARTRWPWHRHAAFSRNAGAH